MPFSLVCSKIFHQILYIHSRAKHLQFSFNFQVLFLSLGNRSLPCTDQRRAPRKPNVANMKRGRPDQLGAKRAFMPCWGLSPVACSFGDGHGNHWRMSKDDRRETSTGQALRGKVRHFKVTTSRTFRHGFMSRH